jgi:hypothetical protein
MLIMIATLAWGQQVAVCSLRMGIYPCIDSNGQLVMSAAGDPYVDNGRNSDKFDLDSLKPSLCPSGTRYVPDPLDRDGDGKSWECVRDQPEPEPDPPPRPDPKPAPVATSVASPAPSPVIKPQPDESPKDSSLGARIVALMIVVGGFCGGLGFFLGRLPKSSE